MRGKFGRVAREVCGEMVALSLGPTDEKVAGSGGQELHTEGRANMKSLLGVSAKGPGNSKLVGRLHQHGQRPVEGHRSRRKGGSLSWFMISSLRLPYMEQEAYGTF